MSAESWPLVSGANGERETETPWGEIVRRWRTPAPEERIGEARFSLWKTDAPLRGSPPRFSPAFFAVVILGSLALILLGGWVAGQVRQGDFLLGQIFGIGLFVAMYGGLLGAAIVRRRRRPRPALAEPPPEGVPPRAVACLAAMRHRGRCVGWLWLEGDLLVFRGAGFDFRLRREDLRARGSAQKALQVGAILQGPSGVSEYRLALVPGAVSGETFVSDRSLWATLEPGLALWESGAFSREPSLFPPVRPVPTVPAPLRWTSFVVPVLFLGGLLGCAAAVLPFEPVNGQPPRSPWGLALAGGAFGLFWPYALWSSDRTSRAYAREVDRAARR